MLKLILLGLLSGIFFSSTYILNELMSSAGGYWFWSASLRYGLTFMLLTVLILIKPSKKGFSGRQRLTELWHIFRQHWQFWCVAGGIGFGVFYSGLCYAADHASAWVVASTFMFTVVASLFVLLAFGQHFGRSVILFSLMIFVGVLLVNINEAKHDVTAINPSHSLHVLLFGALPALLASFSYPIGNQLVWQASHNASNTADYSEKLGVQRFIPTIKTELLDDGIDSAFNKVWLMTLGSFPLWIVLGVLLRPNLPSLLQIGNTFLVALFSGVIATGIFLFARGQAKTPQAVAGVDATQAGEVIFALIGGMELLNTPFPSMIGWLGIVLILLGLVLFSKCV